MDKYEKLECIENAGWVYSKPQGFPRFTGTYPYKSVWDLNAYEENNLDDLIEYMYNRFIRKIRELITAIQIEPGSHPGA